MKLKDEWRSVIGDGAQSVTICGTIMMLVWCADNWDFLPPVCVHLVFFLT